MYWLTELFMVFGFVAFVMYIIACFMVDCTPLGCMIERGRQPQAGEGGEVDGAVAMAMYGSMD